jgi:hypothetical protein
MTTPAMATAIDDDLIELLRVFFDEADIAGKGRIGVQEFDCILQILEIDVQARTRQTASSPDGWTFGDLLSLVRNRVNQGGYDLNQVLQGGSPR